MDCIHVETRAHDDVNARFARYSRQGFRAAPDAYCGRLDDSAASDILVHSEFFDGCIRVHELNVKAVAVVVAPYPSEILQRYGSVF